MGTKGIYYKDVLPLIDRGDLAAVGDSDLLQVIRPGAVRALRPAIRRKGGAPYFIEVEEEVPIEKGLLLAPYWRKANPAEQWRLDSLSEAEARAWGVSRADGEVRIRLLSHLRDIHAAIRQSLRHVPRHVIGQEVRLPGKTLALPGRLRALADLGEEFLNLNAGIAELTNLHPTAAGEVLENLSRLCGRVAAAVKECEALPPAAGPQGPAAAALARVLVDLKIAVKYLRRAECLIAFDNGLREKIGWGYERLMEILAEAGGGGLSGPAVVRAQDVYTFLAEQVHINPYYAERIASPEFQRLAQAGRRAARTALNYVKAAAYKLEAVALPIVRTQVQQRQTRYQQALREFGQATPALADLSALLRDVAERTQDALACESVIIFFQDPRMPGLVVRESLGVPDDALRGLQMDANAGLVQALIRERQARRTADLGVTGPEWDRLAACRVEAVAPILAREGLLGVLCVGGSRVDKPYDREALAFLLDLSGQAALAVERLHLHHQQQARQQELDAAREIQRNLLPRGVPAVRGCDMAALCESCMEVGGDYYDLLKFGDQKVGLMVADVVGKGAPAALLLSNLQAAVKILVNEDTPPGVLAERVNQLIAGIITPNRFITFFYGVLDTGAQSLTYTNAGHNPPLLIRPDGSFRRLDAGGPVIGILPAARYGQEIVALGRRDRLVLYTDGVTEAANAEGEEFGEARLIEQVRRPGKLSAGDLLRRLHQSVRTFVRGDMQDDLTLVIVTIL